MTRRRLDISIPSLDGEQAFLLISILDVFAAELWLAYGDVILGEGDHEPDPPTELEDPNDFPF